MTALGALLAAGLGLLAIGGTADLFAGTRWPRFTIFPYLMGAAGAVAVMVAGAGALAGHPLRLAANGWLGAGTEGLAADRLSGLFLVIAMGAAVPVSLAFASWAGRPGAVGRRGLGASYALALGAVTGIITARDAFTLLMAWELLTIAFYLLAGFERDRPGRPAGAVVTLIFGRISGVALLAGLLLLAVRSGSLDLASFAHVSGSAARSTAQALLIAGFAIKAGLVPFQVWLPRGYAAAPGPARAIMAGVAVNVGFYGLWRTLALLGAPPAWLTTLLLVLAGATALLGIAHAAVQPGLQRVIAYSSVENAGLITAGYGVALTGAALHAPLLAAAGLLAATLQVIAHAAAKSLLFIASAVIAPRGGAGLGGPGDDDDLDLLGGAARRLPWSGTGLAIGSLTLAGLPLTIGFASEWFLLEALMQQFRVPGLGARLALALTGAAVALTVGFAGVTFVRLTGLVVLGPAPAAGRDDAGNGAAREYGWLGRAGIVILSAACLALAAVLPLVVRLVAAGLAPVIPRPVTAGALRSPWVLQPVYPGFSVLSPSWLWIVMPIMALAVLTLTRLAAGTRMLRVRRVPAWRSATAGVEGADRYTAGGFANPTRRILASVLRTRTEISPLGHAGAAADPAGHGPLEDAQAGPEGGRAAPAPGRRGPRLGYQSDVIEVTEEYLYRPLLGPVLAAARAARRLQSGRLDAYLAYMLLALIALLALVTALA